MTRRFHLIIDATGCNSKLISRSKLNEVIRCIAELCNMQLLHGPVVVEGAPENPGLTAFAVIDYSHISIHTFPDELYIDIFSCKDFDHRGVENYIKDAFELDEDMMKSFKIGNLK